MGEVRQQVRGARGSSAERALIAPVIALLLAAVLLVAPVIHAPPAAATLPAGVAPLAAGLEHACALTPSGGVRCWGYNPSGQLGDGTNQQRTSPVAVPSLTSGVKALALGAGHSCALTSGGAARCWGQNSTGQLGNGSTADSTAPVDVTGMSSGVTAIAAGEVHTCALTTAGSVSCWGANANGQLGNGNNTNQTSPVGVSGLGSGVVAISAGDFFSCALLGTGAVKCWGSNIYGQLGNGQGGDTNQPVAVSGLSGATQLNAGGFHACAVISAGAVRCWGNNDHGQLGNGSTTPSSTPVAVSNIAGASTVDGGRFHTCALGSSGVSCWGWGKEGELGNGTLGDSPTPVAVTGLSTGVASIATGAYFACALLDTGGIRCWGYNIHGPLGNGTQTDAATPVAVLGGDAFFVDAPPSGFLRVTTSPAVPSQITVDGVIRDTWSLRWVRVPVGSHTVCFGAVTGFTTPACQSVGVTAEATTVVTGAFVPRGYLRVATAPAVASQIKVDGIARNNWGMWTDVPTGSHQVCFGAVAGFTAPACQTVDVGAGATTEVTGAFVASGGAGQTGVGFLRATTSPAVRSQILVDGNIADSWGLNWVEIAPGPHQVCFSRVEGYTEPTCQAISVTTGATTVVTGTFVPRGFLKVDTSPSVGATISVDGTAADAWGIYTDLPTGTHHVCFGTAPGLTAPPCQDPVVTAGALTAITGSYS